MQSVQVFVKVPTGKTLQVEIDPIHTCFELKKKLKELLVVNKGQAFEPNQQVLSSSGNFPSQRFPQCTGTILEDLKSLSDYNIQQDSTIHLTIKGPPQDILGFDQCKSCQCQAVQPVVLPCGHSCCKTCIAIGATTCPAVGCNSPLCGDSLPLKNWLATQFFDHKPQRPTKLCQICAENGIQKEATHWCSHCASTTDIEYYCGDCDASEHSSRNTRAHVRSPVDGKSNLAFSTCPKHKATEDIFCFDDNIFICHRCRDENHQSPHNTKLVSECEKVIKTELKISLAGLTGQPNPFAIEESLLIGHKEKQQKLIEHYKELIKLAEADITKLESKIEEAHQSAEKCSSATLLLTKAIDEYPIHDLFDQQKLGIMRTRLEQTIKLLSNDIHSSIHQSRQSQLPPFHSSSILKNRRNLFLSLQDLFPTLKTTELLYSAQTHGWAGAQFHQFCDGKYDTVVLIEVGTYVFGGYTHLRWNEKDGYVGDNPDAFLFSLCNPTNSEIGVKFLQKLSATQYSICCKPGFGPLFGGGHDIAISTEANQSTRSYSNLGCTYSNSLCPGTCTPESKTYFCGTHKFKPTNIEVFALTL